MFLFARIFNLVPDPRGPDYNYHCLRRGDIEPSHYGLCVKFLWSKTHVLKLPLISILDSPLCPVRLFYLMCELVPAPGHSPLSVYLSYSGLLKPVLKPQFISVLHARFRAAKDPQYHLFQGHSFRQGILPGPSQPGCQESLFKFSVTGIPMLIRVIQTFLWILSLGSPKGWFAPWVLPPTRRLIVWCVLVAERFCCYWAVRPSLVQGGLVLFHFNKASLCAKPLVSVFCCLGFFCRGKLLGISQD